LNLKLLSAGTCCLQLFTVNLTIAMIPASAYTVAPQIWHWHNLPIAYQSLGTSGPALVLVHGFGASLGHWRKNIPELAQHHRVFALDLVGFGGSAKPLDLAYTFETWGQQIADFCQEVVGEAAYLVGNSIGCIAAMQAAVTQPAIARGAVLLNCSLRMLHERRRAQIPWHQQLSTPLIQSLLSIKPIGYFFFQQLANPKTIKQILRQAYSRVDAVTDELVHLILAPAQDPGAAEVFIAFTRYSQGPLPEDLLAVLSCPALIVWGEADPWEPLELGRKLADFPAVERFVTLPNVGHCPQDEAPEQVNALIRQWVADQISCFCPDSLP
jgi:pimeloyl-ACP methyl ester carboxylesterase